MKKFLTAALSLTFVAGACLGMTGCKPSMDKINSDFGKVMGATNVTVIDESGNTYSKESITATSELSSWSKSVETTKVDYEGMKVHYLSVDESRYVSGLSGATATVDSKEEEEYYMFASGDRYFKVSRNYDEDEKGNQIPDAETPWSVVSEYQESSSYRGELTAKENFQSQISSELPGDSVMMVSMYTLVLQDLFEWNKDTDMWELTMGANEVMGLTRLKKKGGVVLYSKDTLGKSYNKSTYKDVGKTSISIPAEVKAVVDTYIADHPVENE